MEADSGAAGKGRSLRLRTVAPGAGSSARRRER